MTLSDIIQDIHAMEEDLIVYERKYGILSSTFYASYIQGDEPPEIAWVADWNRWAATYEIWQERREHYEALMSSLQKQNSLVLMDSVVDRHRQGLKPPGYRTTPHQWGYRGMEQAPFMER